MSFRLLALVVVLASPPGGGRGTDSLFFIVAPALVILGSLGWYMRRR